jgi:2-amino-4-hydroxy-6-hydroxymethyldihydropteridine diphosphokinase
MELLGCMPGVSVRAVSHYRETVPVGGPPGQPAFLNAACLIDTDLPPAGVLEILAAVERTLQRERTEPGIRQLGLKLLKLADTECNRTNDAALAATGQTLACKKGCAYCCMQPFVITLPELAVLVEAVHQTFGADEINELSTQFGEQKVAQGSPQKMCPLNEDGSCRVYESRPSACRGFVSTDVEACRQKYEEGSEDVAIPSPPGWMIGNAFREGITRGLATAASQSQFLTSAVLSVALKDRGSIQRALEGSAELDEFAFVPKAP